MQQPPDIRAYLALLLYIPICLGIIFAAKKENSVKTVIGVYLGGIMFLPELVAFDAPLVPPLSKQEFAGVMGLVGVVVLQRRRLFMAKPLRGLDLFFMLQLVGNVFTLMTNSDPQVFGEYRYTVDGILWSQPTVVNGHVPGDILSFGVRDVLSTLIPYLLARSIFRTAQDADTLFKVVVIFGLIYAPMCLLEIRISPQLHTWVYGYPSTGMFGVMRGDGFKPVVFQNSGLAVATFLFCCTCCSAVLYKTKQRVLGLPPLIPMLVLWVVLALSHNVAALLYTFIAIPIIFLSKGKLAVTVSVALALVVIFYPFIRGGEMIDVYEITDWVASHSPERAESLNTRLFNEDALLDRARERIWFGWGGYGRNRVYDEFGVDTSITDGEWIIRLGARGIIGFISLFGMLLGPIFVARRAAGKIGATGRTYVDALAIICGMFVADLLPNSFFTKLPLVFTGALAGLVSGMLLEKKGIKQ